MGLRPSRLAPLLDSIDEQERQLSFPALLDVHAIGPPHGTHIFDSACRSPAEASSPIRKRDILSTLPTEVLWLICEGLVKDVLRLGTYERDPLVFESEEPEFEAAVCVDSRSLRALAMTSSRHFERVAPMLYRRVYVSAPEGLSSLMLALLERPVLQSYVRTLYVSDLNTADTSSGSWWPLRRIGENEQRIRQLIKEHDKDVDVDLACGCDNQVHRWLHHCYYAVSICPQITHLRLPTCDALARQSCSACTDDEGCARCASLLRKVNREVEPRLAVVAVNASHLALWNASSIHHLRIFDRYRHLGISRGKHSGTGALYDAEEERWKILGPERCGHPDLVRPSTALQSSVVGLTHLTLNTFRVLDVTVLRCQMPSLVSLTLLCRSGAVNTPVHAMFGSSVFASVTILRLQGFYGSFLQGEKKCSSGRIDVRYENFKVALEQRFPKLEHLGITGKFFQIGICDLPESIHTVEILSTYWFSDHDLSHRNKDHYFSSYKALYELRYSLDMYPNVSNILTPASLHRILTDLYDTVRELGRRSDAIRWRAMLDAMEIIQFYIDFDQEMDSRGRRLCTTVPGERLLSFCGIDACRLRGHAGAPFPCSFCVPNLPSYPRIDCFYRVMPLVDNKVPKQRSPWRTF